MRYTLLNKPAKSALFLLMVFGMLFNTTAPLFALSPEQSKVFDAGISYFNYEECEFGEASSGSGGGRGNATPTANIQEFVDRYGQAAFNVGREFGIPYEAILAQAALESGFGRSGLTREANNFFGIKAGSSWNGPVYSAQTREVGSGGSYMTQADFRAYPTPEAGFRGYGEFITQNSRYARALQYPGDPYRYIQEIKNAGYATDPQYVSSVSNLINEVVSYVRSRNLFPPSSEVQHDRRPPSSSDSSSGGGGGTEVECEEEGASDSGGGNNEVWDRLAQCESSGNWAANTGNGYYGGLQFNLQTWQGHGGQGNPADASREEQIRVAERILATQGWGAWPACSRELGLR